MKESSLQEAQYVLAKVPSLVPCSACGCTFSERLVVFAPAHQQASHHQQGAPSQLVCKTGVYSSTLGLLCLPQVNMLYMCCSSDAALSSL